MKPFKVAQRYGAQVAGVAAGALLPVLAFAQESTPAEQITTKVTEALTAGAGIATAVVLGFFAIWAIKILWRSK